MKRTIGVMIVSIIFVALMGNIRIEANGYVYPDTTEVIAGVEVFNKHETPHWSPFTIAGAGTYGAYYLTHDAYSGSAAMLVDYKSGELPPFNYGLHKTAEYFVVGDTYKIEYYFKPLIKNDDGITYKYVKAFLYMADYSTVLYPVIYDADTGEQLTESMITESKWYRGEITMVMSAKWADSSYGLKMHTVADTMIVDNFKMYRKIGDSYTLIPDYYGIRNGDFEEGVTAVIPSKPKNVVAINAAEAVVLRWDKAEGQQVNVYNKDTGELLGTSEMGADTITIKDLTANTPYTLVLKGVTSFMESDGVEIECLPFARAVDTIDIIEGVEVFSKFNIPHWSPFTIAGAGVNGAYYLTHDAHSGNAAMLVDYKNGELPPFNYELSKISDYFAVGDTYKIEYYFKPLVKNTDGITYKYVKAFLYMADYSTVLYPVIYDADTGEQLTESMITESKWYRGEITMVLTNDMLNSFYGLKFHTVADTMIVDDFKMYRNVNGSYIPIPDFYGIRNGGFEERSYYEVLSIKFSHPDSANLDVLRPGSVTAEAIIGKNTADAVPVRFFMCLYKDGACVKVISEKRSDIKLSGVGGEQLSLTMIVPGLDDGEYELKAMLWDETLVAYNGGAISIGEQ